MAAISAFTRWINRQWAALNDPRQGHNVHGPVRQRRLFHPVFDLLEIRAVPAVNATFNTGVLDITANDADLVTVTAAGGNVQVNGADPTGGPVAANTVTTITVTATGNFDNQINLSGVADADFTGLTTISVNAGQGNDTLTGSPAIVGGGETQTLNGEAGNDTFNLPSGIKAELAGGDGDDNFAFGNGVVIAGTVGGGNDNDTLNYSLYNTGVSVDLAASTATGTSGFSSMEAMTGGSANDTLIGANDANTWNITSNNTGNVDGFGFAATENLTGGTGADSFNFGSGIVLDGTVDGGTGTDTVVGPNTANTWDITGSSAGDLNNNDFTGIENLTGGTVADAFNFGPSGTLGGTLAGGNGNDTLNYTAASSPVTVNLETGAATNTGGISNIEALAGSAGNDTLIGQNNPNTWNLSSNNAGDVDDQFDFASFESLTGGGDNDSFVFATGVGVTGAIDGGLGIDNLDYTAYTAAVTVNLQTGAATGTGGTSNFESVAGGAGSDTLIGPDNSNAWNLIANNTGAVDGFAFASIENLTGGANTDAFEFPDSVGVTGAINGAAGIDTLDYSAYTAAIAVNLQTSDAPNIDGFSNIDSLVGAAGNDILVGQNNANNWSITANNGGAVDAMAFSAFENLSGGTNADTFSFGNGAGVTGTVAGGAGGDSLFYAAYTTGVEVDLENNLATGTGGFSSIEALVGGTAVDSLVGQDDGNTWNLIATNLGSVDGFLFSGVEDLSGGADADTYVFTDGVGMTGEIDGSDGDDTLDYSAYTTAVTVNLDAGVATGTGGVDSIEVVTGGSGDDLLIAGNVPDAATIGGGTGADTLAGGDNDDLLTGGAGNDSFVGGGGTDLLEEFGDVNFTLTDTSLTGLGTDAHTGVEQVSLTAEDGNNVMNAAAFSGDATLDGGAGNDQLLGGSGHDSLLGDLGNDILLGGLGNDSLNGDAGIDTLRGTGNVNFRLTDGVLTGQGADDLEEIERAVLTGGAGNNRLDVRGFTGQTTLVGGAGNDVVIGSTSTDNLLGGDGVDIVKGGAGNDIVRGGLGTDRLYGDAGDDRVLGEGDNDVLIAGTGVDILDGGLGTDVAVGGTVRRNIP
jgi:Ca2+-binding RTX toxin-like protein